MMQETMILDKAAKAGAAFSQFVAVKMGADDDHVIKGAAVSDMTIGIAQDAATAAEDEVRVRLLGISRMLIGGTVTRGDSLTCDANGKGLTAAPAAGTNNWVIGRALASGVNGDIIPVFIMPSVNQG